MGFASTNFRDKVLNWFRGTTFPTVPAKLYVALLTTNPSDENGTGLAEVSTGTWSNYTRQPIASTTSGWAAPSGTNPRQISNALLIDYGTVTATGATTVTGFALYDASTAGTFYGWAALTASKTISNGDDGQFAAGQIVFEQ